MYFSQVLVLIATFGLASAMPADSDPTQCTQSQANSCCDTLSKGLLNVDVLPSLCVPLVGSCNNQAACCSTNNVGLLNCLTVQV